MSVNGAPFHSFLGTLGVDCSEEGIEILFDHLVEGDGWDDGGLPIDNHAYENAEERGRY